MKVCEVCGRELTGRHRYYCSPQCRQVALAQREKAARAQLGKLPGNHQQPKPKVCADCGATFYGYPRSYRCPACQAEADRKHDAEHLQRKKAGHARQIGSVSRCERCGAEYIVDGGLQRYCPACAKEIWKEDALRRYHQDKDAINERRRPSRAEVYKKAVESRVRVCAVCGSEFTASSRHRLYCSDECASKASAARNKKRRNPMARTSPRARGAQSPIATARIAAGLTQAQLAEAVGCKPLAISRWEHGFCSPSSHALSLMAQVLGCQMDDLIQTKNAGE